MGPSRQTGAWEAGYLSGLFDSRHSLGFLAFLFGISRAAGTHPADLREEPVPLAIVFSAECGGSPPFGTPFFQKVEQRNPTGAAIRKFSSVTLFGPPFVGGVRLEIFIRVRVES